LFWGEKLDKNVQLFWTFLGSALCAAETMVDPVKGGGMCPPNTWLMSKK